jgi:PilZ domain
MPSDDSPEAQNVALTYPPERRRNLRFPFSAEVELTESTSGAKIKGRTSDLGLGGCYIDAFNPLAVGTEAKIRIVRENESFEAHVKVVYSQVGLGMGVAFVSAQPKQFQLFQRWLLEISGTSSPIPEKALPEPAYAGRNQTLSTVLCDLIARLMQKKLLGEAEGKEMLDKLLR